MKTLPLFASIVMLLCGISSLTLAAQTTNSTTQGYSSISGKVLDASTGKPLQFASISLIHSSISNVSNADGIFSLKIPLENMTGRDSILVSYMGYRSRRISTQDFTEDRTLRIGLELSPFRLDALTIYPNDPKAIFEMVFSKDRISQNYPTQPEGMTGFYREIIKKGRKYGSATEAVLNISKASYTNIFTNDNVSLFLGRSSRNFSIRDTVMMKMEGGPLSNLFADVMKSPFVGTTLESATYYYNFKFGVPLEENGRSIVVIDFDQKDSSDVLYHGEMFIDKETLALVRITFHLNVDLSEDSWTYLVRYIPSNVSVKANNADFIVNYKVVGDKLRFDYSRIELGFSAKYRERWLKSNYSVVCELAITDYNNPAALKIPAGQRVKWRDDLSSTVRDFSNPDFWQDYNIIEPDASFQSVLRKIVRQLKRNQ